MGYPLKHIVGFDGETYDIPEGGGIKILSFASGDLYDEGGAVYLPQDGELFLMTSQSDFDSVATTTGFSFDAQQGPWAQSLASATWKTRFKAHRYLLCKASEYYGSLYVTILEGEKLLWKSTAPLAKQIKYYLGAAKYKATADSTYKNVADNLAAIYVSEDFIVAELTQEEVVQDIQVLMNTTNGRALMGLEPIFTSKDDPVEAGGLYAYSVHPVDTAVTTYRDYKSQYTGASQVQKYIVFRSFARGNSFFN